MILLLLYITSGVIVVTGTSQKPYYAIERAEDLFEDFIKTYDKRYSHEAEKQKRLKVFTDNLKVINENNAMDGATFAVNAFADLTAKEFTRSHMGYKPVDSIGGTKCKVINDDDITRKNAPDSLDWEQKGKVTKVKNQEHCGSCWAFAAVGNIEGQYAIKHNKQAIFSEQQLVDCSDNNLGCLGGTIIKAFQDTIDIGGIQLDSTYNYTARNQYCSFDKAKVKQKLMDCNEYKVTDEDKLKEVLAKIGPLGASLSGDYLAFYEKGIFTLKQCPNVGIDHAVLLVGYGTEDGVNYWRIKNSWGEIWGEKGYFRITRGNNTCGIMVDGSSSVVL